MFSHRTPGMVLNSDSFQEATVTLCSSQRSPQQVLYQLYNAITMTELKGYAMMQFSYMLLKTYGKGENSHEVVDRPDDSRCSPQEITRKSHS